MATVTRTLPALCLVLVLIGLSASVAAARTAPQADDPETNELQANESDTNATANATVDISSWNATVWTGPPTLRERLPNRTAIARATRNGTLTRNHTVTPAHTLAIELYAPELDGRIVDADGSNETMRFFAATHGPGSVLQLEQKNPYTHRNPRVAALNETGATRVVTDGRNDTYYLVVDPSALEYYWEDVERSYRETGRVVLFQSQRQRDLGGGEEFGLDVMYEGAYREFGEWPDGDEEFVRFREVDLASPEALGWSSLGRLFSFRRAADQHVRFRGSVPAGTTATVRIEDRVDDGPPLERTVTFRRPEAGNATRGQTVAETAFDLSNLSGGVSFDVVVRRGSWRIESGHGAVEPDSPHIAVETQYDWQPQDYLDNGRIDVRCVSLPRRARVAVGFGRWTGLALTPWHPEDRDATYLDAGTHRNLTLEFESDSGWESAEYATVVAIVESDDDGDINSNYEDPLVVNGTVVAETVRLANESAGERAQSAGPVEQCAPAQMPETQDQQVRTTAQPTATTEVKTTDESLNQSASTTTSGVGPGFGAVVGAVGLLVATVAGLLVGTRSREN